MQLQEAVTKFDDKTEKLIQLVKELKKQRNAVILVHNYQKPEMYKIADYIGDSLGLSKQAAETDADVILFCGVKFMAETAKILSPDKTVLLPTLEAGCSLADMATPEKLAEVKKMHPDAAIVSYVNTTADIKAMSDVCCTSMNAVKIVDSFLIFHLCTQDAQLFLHLDFFSLNRQEFVHLTYHAQNNNHPTRLSFSLILMQHISQDFCPAKKLFLY